MVIDLHELESDFIFCTKSQMTCGCSNEGSLFEQLQYYIRKCNQTSLLKSHWGYSDLNIMNRCYQQVFGEFHGKLSPKS